MPMAAKIMWNPSESSIWMRAAVSEDIGVSPLYRGRAAMHRDGAVVGCRMTNGPDPSPAHSMRAGSRWGDQNAAAPASATA